MRILARAAVLVTAIGALLVVPVAGTPQAQAHPLGNFTVNNYDGLTLRPDGVDVLAVLDTAELPTVQQQPVVDTDGDGTVSPAEAAAHGTAECAARLAVTAAIVDGTPVTLAVASSAAEFPPGDQGLATTRVTCRFTGAADLGGRSTVEFTDGFRGDRIGWREITATGAGLRISGSDVPEVSASRELRSYPDDLLASPLDQRAARISVEPGSGSAAPLAALPLTGVGWLDGLLGSAEDVLSGLAARPELTPAVGTLAVLLSLVLGASHALLPGHGKTVMAAYLAGKQGTRRDAVVVGAAVTVTHTAGVLVFGLLLVAVAAFSPVTAMAWLGVVSGLLVAAVGAALPVAERTGMLVGAAVGGSLAAGQAGRGHGHGHGHGHGGHGHGHGHGGHGHGPDGWSRASLVGMGMAGGLVPSPTALLVLLGAVNLGRTWFGVALVACYGLGMAGTLTVSGLLLVSVRDRIARMERTMAWRGRAGRLLAVLPVATALLVLVVGLGLALRSLAGI